MGTLDSQAGRGRRRVDRSHGQTPETPARKRGKDDWAA